MSKDTFENRHRGPTKKGEAPPVRPWQGKLGLPPYPFIKKKAKIPRMTYIIANYLSEHWYWYAEYSPTNRNRTLWCYNPRRGLYQKTGQKDVQEIADDWLREQFKVHIVREIVGRLFARHSNCTEESKLGGPPHKILLHNGVYDINENKFEPLDEWTTAPEEYHITSLPFDYDPNATCPNIESFLKGILRDNENPDQDLEALLEGIGYTLFKDYPHAIVQVLLGRGSNGKSTLLELWRQFLGPENCTAVTPQHLTEHRFKIARLHGRLANIAGDIPARPLAYTGVIKTLSGGDLITAEHKGQDPFDFVNYAKLIISCNRLPPAFDDTDAFHRRINIIDFVRQFPEGHKDTRPRHELLAEIITPSELAGLFNLVIEPLKRLLKKGELTGNEGTVVKRLKYFERSDPIKLLAYKYCYHDPTGEILCDVLYNLYVDLCNQLKPRFGHTAFSPRSFGKWLRKAGPWIDREQRSVEINGEVKKLWHYTNVRVDMDLFDSDANKARTVSLPCSDTIGEYKNVIINKSSKETVLKKKPLAKAFDKKSIDTDPLFEDPKEGYE